MTPPGKARFLRYRHVRPCPPGWGCYRAVRSRLLTAARPLPAISSATATATATAAWAVPFRTSFVHRDAPAVNLGKIDFLDRLFRLLTVGHLDECEPAGASRFTVLDDVHRRHLAVFSKRLADIFFGSIERQVANVNVCHSQIPFCTRANERKRESSVTNAERNSPGGKGATNPPLESGLLAFGGDKSMGDGRQMIPKVWPWRTHSECHLRPTTALRNALYVK